MFLRLRLDKMTQLINLTHVQAVLRYNKQVCIWFQRGDAPLIVTAVSVPMAQRLIRKFEQK